MGDLTQKHKVSMGHHKVEDLPKERDERPETEPNPNSIA